MHPAGPKEDTMNKSPMSKGSLIFVSVLTVLLMSGVGAMAAAKGCTMVGTWFGAGDSGITWMATNAPGPSATAGEVNIEWVLMDATLGGFFPAAVRVTNAVGVWQKGSRQIFPYTWVAYAFDVNGALVYTARASGVHTAVDCDHWNITYVLEIWLPSQDMNDDPPYFCAPGTATETRMPLVQATCPH
jgi:hypothetical protein